MELAAPRWRLRAFSVAPTATAGGGSAQLAAGGLVLPTIHAQLMLLPGGRGAYLWLGTEPTLGSLAMAMPTRFVSLPPPPARPTAAAAASLLTHCSLLTAH